MPSPSRAFALTPPRHDASAAARVERAVSELRELARGATLSVTLEIGRVIVTTLYDGDLGAFRARGKKDATLRSLATRPDLPISASSIFRALSLYELAARLGASASTWKHLGASHLRSVVGLPAEVQADLVERAERGRWTVLALEQETRRFRSNQAARSGRKPLPEYLKSIRRLSALTGPAALEGLDAVDALADKERAELLEIVSQVRRRVALLESVLRRPQRSANAANDA